MRIRSLHDRVDDVPLAVRGVKLENGQFQNFYDGELQELVEQHEGQVPVSSEIVTGATVYHPPTWNPLWWIKSMTHDWRLKKKMQKEDVNFAYLQFGASCVSYDFFKI